jgi:hypothetical protein
VDQPAQAIELVDVDRLVRVLLLDTLRLPIVTVLHPVVNPIAPVSEGVAGVVAVRLDLGGQEVRAGDGKVSGVETPGMQKRDEADVIADGKRTGLTIDKVDDKRYAAGRKTEY